MKRNTRWLFVFKKEKESFKIFIYFLLSIIPVFLLVSFIHETGHLIVALVFGWKINEISFSFFPFILDLDPSFISVSLTGGYFEWQFVIFIIAGSTHTLIWGYISFIIYYKYDLPIFLEIILFLYSITLILEMFFYIIMDLFYFQYGDWYYLYKLNPVLLIVFIIIGSINFSLFIRNYDIIFEKIDD
jgi:hypothetical protein